ncbi:hypothetical protein EDC01DRAFT_633577 [Geopyxis carbonaria]|nr:hypothetical protein EDC01DRAFT_633577 [Geopyxis carbonaria]
MASTAPPDPKLIQVLNLFIAKYHHILVTKASHDLGEPVSFPAPDTTDWPLHNYVEAIRNLGTLARCMLLQGGLGSTAAEQKWRDRGELAMSLRELLDMYKEEGQDKESILEEMRDLVVGTR